MPDITELHQYMALVDKLVQIADKDDLAECARLLAMNVAHYEMRYGALPLEEQLAEPVSSMRITPSCSPEAWKPWPAF